MRDRVASNRIGPVGRDRDIDRADWKACSDQLAQRRSPTSAALAFMRSDGRARMVQGLGLDSTRDRSALREICASASRPIVAKAKARDPRISPLILGSAACKVRWFGRTRFGRSTRWSSTLHPDRVRVLYAVRVVASTRLSDRATSNASSASSHPSVRPSDSLVSHIHTASAGSTRNSVASAMSVRFRSKCFFVDRRPASVPMRACFGRSTDEGVLHGRRAPTLSTVRQMPNEPKPETNTQLLIREANGRSVEDHAPGVQGPQEAHGPRAVPGPPSNISSPQRASRS